MRELIVAVVGPTAAGKSDFAVDFALENNGEVINVDSMQIYRGMDIGTAKLSVAERKGIPHHLIDILDVTEPATVAEFQNWARAAIADCQERDVVPVLVGGSALYMRAVLDDFEFPGTDEELRATLEAQLAEIGSEEMHARLAELDPAAALAILPGNGRRIVRALEVIELTGKPFSASLPKYESIYPNVHWVGLEIDRESLDERIAARVEKMWEQGFVNEVRSLKEHGLETGRTASRALGYQQILDFLNDRCTEDEAKEATKVGTRQFARRQWQWFGKDPRIQWQRRIK